MWIYNLEPPLEVNQGSVRVCVIIDWKHLKTMFLSYIKDA